MVVILLDVRRFNSEISGVFQKITAKQFKKKRSYCVTIKCHNMAHFHLCTRRLPVALNRRPTLELCMLGVACHECAAGVHAVTAVSLPTQSGS